MNFCVLDLETTGFSPVDDRVIEIALVRIRKGEITDTFTTLIDPEISIPEKITDITGISNSDVEGKPVFADILDEIEAFAGDDIIIAHNAPFDKSFMDLRWSKDNPWIDSVAFARIVWPMLPSHSLENLMAYMGMVNEDAHRSLSDTLCTAKLFLRLLEEYKSLQLEVHRNILSLNSLSFTPLMQLLRRLSSNAFNKKSTAGTPIVFQQFHPYAPVIDSEIEYKAKDDEYTLPQEITDRYFSEERMKNCFPLYEERPQQAEMAAAVADAFNSQSILLAEAGTGTGKSLAYLLPAALFALNSGHTVAVSTHTLTLQDQLINKDIPLVKKILGCDFKAAVLKGRSNYVCLRCFENMLFKAAENDMEFAARFIVWLSQTTDGDGSILLLTPEERWKWRSVAAAKETCIGPKCRHYNSDCFVYNNRRAAALCDIVIINHSLLIADASFEKGFLPELPYLIIDEAHHLEKVAGDQLASKLSYYDIKTYLERIIGRENDGVLKTLEKSALQLIDGAEDEQILKDRLLNFEFAVSELESQSDSFFMLARDVFLPMITDNYIPAKIRITEQLKEGAGWQNFRSFADSLSKSLMRFVQALSSLLDCVSVLEIQTERSVYGKEELRMLGLTFREYAAVLEDIAELDVPQENYVSWVQFGDLAKMPDLHIAPIELAEPLNSCLFMPKRSIVFSSATLTTGTSFEYYKRSVGLDICDKEITELQLASPFYYNEQARFIICDDMPEITRDSEQVFLAKTADLLIDIIAAAQGRSLILFTSNAQLKSVYNKIRKPLEQHNIQVLAQGMGVGRNTILQRFRNEERSCILGSSTFWEGIDVIGEKLSLVVIVKLPFWPPVTPTVQAKCEEIEKRGNNPFMDYSLPEAVIRFKQGFGRLIRSSEDQGVFIVLDRRLIDKRYGRIFIEALPEMPLTVSHSEEIPYLVEDWLQ